MAATSTTPPLNGALGPNPYATLGVAGIAGTAGAIPTPGSQTETPILSPENQALLSQLGAQYSHLAQTGVNLQPYQEQQENNINNNANLVAQSSKEALAARGLADSPVSGVVASNENQNRVAQITGLQQSIPLLSNQLQLANLGAASQFTASIPRGFQSNTKQGGGLGGFLGGLGSILANSLARNNNSSPSSNSGGGNNSSGVPGSNGVEGPYSVGSSPSDPATDPITGRPTLISQPNDPINTSTDSTITYGDDSDPYAGLPPLQTGNNLGSGYSQLMRRNLSGQSFSDKRLKENVTDVTDGLDKILKMKPKEFNYKSDIDPTGEVHSGFMAQDLEKLFPSVVNTDQHSGMKMVKYGELIPKIVKAIQEMHGKMSEIGKSAASTVQPKGVTA